VNYATANGSATAGSDYTAASGAVTFNPGQTTQTVAVALSNDTAAEGPETFSLVLSASVNATIADGTGVATIADDDISGLPTLSITDVTVSEGNSGTKNAKLTVTLSAASAQVVTVSYATANGTAQAPGDYVAAAGALSFNPGVTSITITVAVVGERVSEPTESFYVDLSGATGATIQKSRGTVTIPAND
jgi:chitinase